MTRASHENFKLKRTLLDQREMARAIRRMAGELTERHPDLDEMMLVGIRTRGVPLSERLAAEIESLEGRQPAIGTLDITLYRDDLSTVAPKPVVKGTSFPGPIDNRVVVLCDDVLYTGRTVRAALDELSDYGRPKAVRLAVLVDRGHREVPIQADIVGKQLATARSELVEVGFEATDGQDVVHLLERLEETPSAEDSP